MFSFHASFWNTDVYINGHEKYAANEILTAYLNAVDSILRIKGIDDLKDLRHDLTIESDMKSRRSLTGEKKFYLSDLSFYYALNTDNRIHYGPVLENIVCTYAASLDYSVSVGRIGKLECDFILRDNEMNYSYVQVAYISILRISFAHFKYPSE